MCFPKYANIDPLRSFTIHNYSEPFQIAGIILFQVEIAKVLHRDFKVDLKDIAVLTPYFTQKEKIKLLVKDDKIMKKLTVATINDSQGNKKNPIFF